MKIGLISYHFDPNYGTMLQAYALSHALNKLGVENEYLYYHSTEKKSKLFVFLRALIRKIIPAKPSQFDFFYSEDFSLTLKAFHRFHKVYIPTSSKLYYTDTVEDVNCLYDKFIVGSDQTWSEYMNRSGNTANFLNFVTDNSKKNSYAPSIGSLTISEEYSKILLKNLQSFEHLSCREKPNCIMLSQLLGKKVEYVLDPTLLLSPEDWNKVATKPSLPVKKYILAYILGEKTCIAEYAESLGKKESLPVYYLLTRPKYLAKDKCLSGVGPAEFIGLVRDAAYVVTDSFHGTAFCINFGVQVYCFTKRIPISGEVFDNDRILLLLSEFGLENRAKEDSDISFERDYDLKKYQEHLNELRISSWQYLKKILEE